MSKVRVKYLLYIRSKHKIVFFKNYYKNELPKISSCTCNNKQCVILADVFVYTE